MKLWREDATGLLTVDIPTSVERVASLDDSCMISEYAKAYGHAEWIGTGRKMKLSKRAYVALVDTVLNLAGDQITEDLSVGGALKWARNRADALVKTGWAKREWTGGVEPV